MASFLDIEDNIRQKPGLARTVKSMAVMIVAAAAIGGAFAKYDHHKTQTLQSVQECVQIAVDNSKEAALKYSETGADVFKQIVSSNMAPVSKQLASENSFSTVKSNVVFAKSFRSTLAQQFEENAQFNLNAMSEKDVGTIKSACESEDFRADVAKSTISLSKASADAESGLSAEQIDARTSHSPGISMIKIDREAIKVSRENSDTPNLNVKVRLIR